MDLKIEDDTYRDVARHWYGKGVEWMQTHRSANESLIRVRIEAAELLGVDERNPPGPSTAPTTATTQAPQD